MDQFTAILMAIFAIVMLILIGIYNKADSQRFRLDRFLKKEQEALDAWAAACEELQPGSSSAYRAAKKNWQRTACLQQMVQQVQENSEEKLELQEQLLEFCCIYSRMAGDYNKKLEDPVQGKLLQRLGFRPYTALDFYPGVGVEEK